MNADQKGNIILLAGNSHKDLATLVANRLGIALGQCRVGQNTARETLVEIIESVRGKDIYILQTGTTNVNNDVMEMLIMCYALKTSCARSITGIIPYMPYGRQSKMRFRSCIASKLIAKMMVKAGFSHILTVDLRSKEMQGFFDVPVDNLRALGFLIVFLQNEIPELATEGVIIAKDAHATQKATSFSERLKLPLAVIHGRRKDSDADSEDLDRAPSPPPYSMSSRPFEMNFLPLVQRKSRLPMSVVGDVSGKICVVVDDSIEEIEPFCTAAEVLREAGAKKVFVCCTHGILPIDAVNVLNNNSSIDEVIVTNTVPLGQKNASPKIKTVDVSMLLAEAIRRIHYCESMSYLYRNVTDGE